MLHFTSAMCHVVLVPHSFAVLLVPCSVTMSAGAGCVDAVFFRRVVLMLYSVTMLCACCASALFYHRVLSLCVVGAVLYCQAVLMSCCIAFISGCYFINENRVELSLGLIGRFRIRR